MLIPEKEYYVAETFERLQSQNQAGRYLCVGLDPNPTHVAQVFGFASAVVIPGGSLGSYCGQLAEGVATHTAAFKAQYACWARFPAALRGLFRDLRRQYPEIPLILDGKFGDIGNTMKYWADFANYLGADAVTANPYMGIEDVGSALADSGLDVFFLASTSNEGSEDIQRTPLRSPGTVDELVADMVNFRNRNDRPYGLVIGATRPDDLSRVMTQAPCAPLLVPGIGTQGGDTEAAVRILRNHPSPWTINVSRGIAEAVQKPSRRGEWLDGATLAAKKYATQFAELARE